MKVLKLKQGEKGWEQDEVTDTVDLKCLKDDGKPGIKYKVLGDPENEAEYRKRGWLV